MKSSLPSPTKAESRRMDIIKRDIGCIACRQGNLHSQANAHHILSGGRRISHAATLPLCDFHHTGLISIHASKRGFVKDYGTEMELLAETNRLVAAFEANIIGKAP